jgi:hypothetical protein
VDELEEDEEDPLDELEDDDELELDEDELERAPEQTAGHTTAPAHRSSTPGAR